MFYIHLFYLHIKQKNTQNQEDFFFKESFENLTALSTPAHGNQSEMGSETRKEEDALLTFVRLILPTRSFTFHLWLNKMIIIKHVTLVNPWTKPQ